MDNKMFGEEALSGYINISEEEYQKHPEYFCDRKDETADLLETLNNGRNITLTSPRRMGKTGLIKHCFHLLKKQDQSIVVIYIDLFPTENLTDFTQAFASAVLGQLDSNPMKLLYSLAYNSGIIFSLIAASFSERAFLITISSQKNIRLFTCIQIHKDFIRLFSLHQKWASLVHH